MYLGGYRVIIELKKKKVLRNGPKAPNTGSQPDETAFEQLSRQVKGDMNREQTRLDEDRDNGWVGCVTDSEHWWVWIWSVDGGEPQRFLNFDGIIPTKDQKQLLLDRFRRGTQWAPPDPYYLFEPVLQDFKNLYMQYSGARETRIQRQLWLEQLRASGQPPDPTIADDLFVRHTLLILIAQLVGGVNAEAGFVGWVPDGPVLQSLRDVIGKYDWRNATGDILRKLYMKMIDSKSRLIFGEFYTPDWLAEKLCLDIIDNAFIQEQLDNFGKGEQIHGVLDVACGSGTFLYHATQRILNSEPLRISHLNADSKRKFVLSMINGLDIHPVAVEMARANMGRIFPGVPVDHINIHQGDSLLITRPDTGLHALAADSLTVFTPGGRQFMIPNGFLHDREGIRRFVMSARDDVDMPSGLGHELTQLEQEILDESHHALRGIICNEGNGIWAWYIQNQASAILLRQKKVGRIVSNPPWVRFNKIQDQSRKDEIHALARDLGLWVGGKVATSFDISQLFVVRCSNLYLNDTGKSSWVLPHGALYGDGWREFRNKMDDMVTGRWHLGRLPFPNTPTCVLWFGPEQENCKFIKTKRGKLEQSASWDGVEGVMTRVPLPSFPREPSGWMDGDNVLARAGATLVPHCLVKIDTVLPEGNVTTRRSMHSPWHELGTFTGSIPEEWIHQCLFFSNLMPFHIPNTTPCILPIIDDDWDPDRMRNDMYRLLFDTYANNCGLGGNTPQDLESRLNHQNTLFAQFSRVGPQVLYNRTGDNIYAARMTERRIIDVGLFTVPCRTDDEALFLTAILNAPSLLEALCAARQSDRDFVGHIWKKIPMPRYDSANSQHQELVRLSTQAEDVSQTTYDPTITEKRNRNNINNALTDSGVFDSINDIIRVLFPNHAVAE